MKSLSLMRYGSIPGIGTFGQLTLWGAQSAPIYTCRCVEREWLDNLPNKSCIPTGVYTMQLGMYYGGDGVGGAADYPAYEVQNVPGRSLIKVHIANYADQLLGCIAPGEHFGVVKGYWGVVDSRHAFESLMAFLDGDPEVELDVSWARNP